MNQNKPIADFATGNIIYIPEGWKTIYCHFKVPNTGAHISLLAKSFEHAKENILQEYPMAFDIREITEDEFISVNGIDRSKSEQV